MNEHTWECGRGHEVSFQHYKCPRCSRMYSRNGSRIPDPMVDNARPSASCRTWATIGPTPVLVTTKPMAGSPGLKTPRGRLQLYVAQLETDGSCAYGNGPGEAVKRLDELLSQGT